MTKTSIAPLKKKDFVSDQDVRWCPGCGDYSILAQTQKTMPDLDIPKEKIVFVAGIGCSSRFPYYMDTFGFHTIHGRAPAIASGIKVSNPDLSVWVITAGCMMCCQVPRWQISMQHGIDQFWSNHARQYVFDCFQQT